MPKKFTELKCRAKKVIQNRQKENNTKDKQLIDELTLHKIELEIQNEDLIKAQIDLLESRNKYIALYELAPVGYFCLDENAIIKEVNRAGCDLLGLSKYSLINRCFTRYIVSEYQLLFSQFRRQILKDMMQNSCEIKLQKWHSSSFLAMIDSKTIRDENSGLTKILIFVTDVTEKKRLENNLHQQRIKMASVDRVHSLNEFVINLTDEHNHCMTIINNYLQGCIHRLEADNYKKNDLLLILKKVFSHTHLLTKTINENIFFMEKMKYFFEKKDINSIIRETILLFSHEMNKYPINIHFDLVESDVNVKLDVPNLQQAILNIARNAFESMRDAKILEPKLLIETVTTENKMIKVSFLDNGPGFTEETLQQIFEPNFTTKSYTLGLGLSVSRKIIEKHGGQLMAISNQQGGACVSFTLPYS